MLTRLSATNCSPPTKSMRTHGLREQGRDLHALLAGHRGEEVTDDVIDVRNPSFSMRPKPAACAKRHPCLVVSERSRNDDPSFERTGGASGFPTKCATMPWCLFAVEPLDVRARAWCASARRSTISRQHGYPTPVARLVGEACVLTVLLATSLKIEGRFQLQTRGDGAIGMLVVDFDTPDRLRALARFDADKLGARLRACDLLGTGHLAVTVEQSDGTSRYQGSFPCRGRDWRMPLGNISTSPRRFQHECVSPLRKM